MKNGHAPQLVDIDELKDEAREHERIARALRRKIARIRYVRVEAKEAGQRLFVRGASLASVVHSPAPGAGGHIIRSSHKNLIE